jgi:Bacterial Ig-like domain (group 2).
LTTTTNGTAGTPAPVTATLTSDDTSVATVSGLVATGKKGGTAHISASYVVDGKTITTETPATLNVEDVVTYALTITPASATINYNETQTYVVNLTTTTNGTAGTPAPVTATLTSDDTSVATVSGLVATGKKGGTAHISASYVVDGKTITTGTPATLNVEDVVSYKLVVEPAGEDAKVYLGKELQFKASLITVTNGEDGSPVELNSGVIWTSSTPAIATIGETTGKATGVTEGETTITAKYTPSGSTQLSEDVTLKSSKEPDHSGDPIGIGEEEEL